MRTISGLARIGFEKFRPNQRTGRVSKHRDTQHGIHEERRAPIRLRSGHAVARPTFSKSCGTSRRPVRFVQACCKAQRHAASVIRAQEFGVPSKNPAFRAAHEGTRPFHVRGPPLSHRDRAILAHRQSECRVCDSFVSRANSIRATRPGKALHPYTVRLRPRLRAGPTKHA